MADMQGQLMDKPRVMGTFADEFYEPDTFDAIRPESGGSRGEIYVVRCASRSQARQVLEDYDVGNRVRKDADRDARNRAMMIEVQALANRDLPADEFMEKFRGIIDAAKEKEEGNGKRSNS